MLLEFVVGIAVATAAWQAGADPMSAFARVRDRLFADTARLPRYTCVQTVRRTYFQPTVEDIQRRGCDAILGARIRRKYDLPVASVDTLRLDVAVASGREIHSWVGANRFDDRELVDLVDWGPSGTGDFRGFVQSVFGPESTISYEREAEDSGRKLLEYSYTVPQERSRWLIRAAGARVISGFAGSILLDPENSDLLRLQVVSDELPEETELCQAILVTDYHRVRIGGYDVPVPEQTRLRMVTRDGTETENVTTYGSCREYASESVVRFQGEDVPVPLPPRRRSSLPPPPFPAGIEFRCKIQTPIDERSAAGDPIDAVLTEALEDRRGIHLAPAGSVIRGIARLTHHYGSNERFDLGVKFDTILVDGVEIPFAAGIAQVVPGGGAAGKLRVRSRLRFPADIQPDVGTFAFPGAHLKVIGLDGKWVTAELPVAKGKK